MTKDNILKTTLTLIIVLLAFGLYYQNDYYNSKIEGIQEGLRVAEFKLIDNITNYITPLGEKIQQQPDSENLAWLSREMRDQQRNFEILLDLNRFRMDEETLQKYKARTHNQATAFIINLSLRDEVSQQDLDKVEEIVDAWGRFYKGLPSLYITDETIKEFVDAYVQLFSDLSIIAPSR